MGNWANIERMIRLYAQKNNRSVHVYVGSTGILQLESENGTKRKIYLRDTKHARAIPVPKVLFSLVYDKIKKSAIVILTINNPYIRELDRDSHLCNDICQEIGFDFRNRENFEKGYSYCCNYEDAKKTIPFLPQLRVQNLMYFDRKTNRRRLN